MTIEMSEKEYKTFSILTDAGVFDIRNGKATLNFDAQGTLCEVECSLKLYKIGAPLVIKLHSL